jgi:hypothetical protein
VRFLKQTDPGWSRVWSLLQAKYGSVECLDEETGESWQYMGSSIPSTNPADEFMGEHQFRHRNLRGARVYDYFPVQEGDFALASDNTKPVEKKQVKLSVVLTIDIQEDVDPYWKSNPCDRAQALFTYGVIKDAFDTVGLSLVDAKVREVQ